MLRRTREVRGAGSLSGKVSPALWEALSELILKVSPAWGPQFLSAAVCPWGLQSLR